MVEKFSNLIKLKFKAKKRNKKGRDPHTHTYNKNAESQIQKFLGSKRKMTDHIHGDPSKIKISFLMKNNGVRGQ